MKTTFSNGVRKITLTKSEINAVNLARDVCNELSLTAHDDVRSGAAEARDGLTDIIRRYCPDAAQSEPESTASPLHGGERDEDVEG